MPGGVARKGGVQKVQECGESNARAAAAAAALCPPGRLPRSRVIKVVESFGSIFYKPPSTLGKVRRTLRLSVD